MMDISEVKQFLAPTLHLASAFYASSRVPLVLRKVVRPLGAHHRFASTDSILASARLERFWRTLKQLARLDGLHLPLTRQDLEGRLELPLAHYLCFRPHEGLPGATPAEAFFGATPAHQAAVEPPRGRPGESLAQAPFVIEYLDPDKRRFPVLKRAA